MKMFGEFSAKKLAKDDLYYSIKNEIELKEKELDKKKKKPLGANEQYKNPNAPVLPTIHKDNMAKIKADMHRKKVEQMIRQMQQEDEERKRAKDPERMLERERERPRTPAMVKHFQETQKAFQGDFDKLDDEIKVQLKAIKNNDFKTIEKIHKQELSAEEQKVYLMSTEERKALIQEYDDNYDSDLEQALYQEYWTDLRDMDKDKKKDQKRKAQSAVRGASMPQSSLAF